jgi:hypothetical protein
MDQAERRCSIAPRSSCALNEQGIVRHQRDGHRAQSPIEPRFTIDGKCELYPVMNVVCMKAKAHHIGAGRCYDRATCTGPPKGSRASLR